MEYPGLVAKMIRILANMVFSEEKAKKAVKDVNGEEVVKNAMAKHAQHTQLVKAGEQLLKKMNEVAGAKKAALVMRKSPVAFPSPCFFSISFPCVFVGNETNIHAEVCCCFIISRRK